jgi:uncharacterized protein (DUF362 family)/Pyruvate/2-oxoacid:ferredoxin oxidoreductase delta subunit
MKKVVLAGCSSYGIDEVRQAVKASVDLLGGMRAFVNPGERVLLKANLLMRRKPERATTTHPAVVQAVAELVAEAGGRPVIFDSPGGYTFHTRGTLESLYEVCGMKDAARAGHAELCYETEVLDAPFERGRMIKNIKTLKCVPEADRIINIPKLKTHMMMGMSGAVKNLFGIVPGGFKTEYHFRFEDENEFAGAIVDICEFAKPALTVVDAVVGMEGNGPANGEPRHIGFILAGADPYALDVAAAGVLGLEPASIPTIRESARRGLCSGKIKDVRIIGEKLDAAAVPGFKKPDNHVAFNIYNWLLPKFAAKRLNRLMKFKPVFRHGACRGCGVCAQSCPAKAIVMNNDKPVVDLYKCISCFCCHELCNFDAVDIRKPWLFKVLFR